MKNATQDIQRLKEKIAAFAQVLKSLYELIHEHHGNKITTREDLVNNIAKCSSALTKLKTRIDSERTQKGIRRWGLQVFKWPLARQEVYDTILELKWYKTTFGLSLQVDQMYILKYILMP